MREIRLAELTTGPTNVSSLAASGNISRSVVRTLIPKLIDRGWVKRDGRVIRTTPKYVSMMNNYFDERITALVKAYTYLKLIENW